MNIHRILIVLCIVFAGLQQANSQNNALIIQKADNSLSNTELTTIKKITFQNSNLVLHYTSGTTGEFLLTDVRKIMFGPVSEVINPQLNETELIVFPNPASDFLWIKDGVTKNEEIRIISVTGQLILNIKHITQDNKIDISGLKPGVYFIRTNGALSKFIKL